MWIAEGKPEPPFRISPALAAVLIVTVVGTLVLGIYPRVLFDFAAYSAATLGAAPLVR
jgi:NADH:ubiquinone oxidoreductase subunit 2 (subunit N)